MVNEQDVVELCEVIENDADDAVEHAKLPLSQHELGFQRGMKKAAKSIRNSVGELARLEKASR